MSPFIRRLSSVLAAFALIQAMAAPALAACDRSHDDVAAVTAPQTAPSAADHAGCEGMETTPVRTQHQHDCQLSCVAMVGCASLSFAGSLMALGLPDEASSLPALPTRLYSSRSLPPDSPPPKA